MSKVSIYVNFMGNTEEAFNFYKSVFKTEFIGNIARIGDNTADPNQPPLSEADKTKVMHIALPILGGTVLMGTDMLESMGHKLEKGNNMSINLEPDTREEAQRLFNELSAGGSDIFPLTDMFWGAMWAAFVDKYGIRWMINCTEPKK